MAARTGVKPLTSERVRNDVTDQQMREQIMNGSRSKTMPAFQGALSDEQVTAVIAHVRSLAETEAQVPAN
jgi:mono/diheme cytochrome c family protein